MYTTSTLLSLRVRKGLMTRSSYNLQNGHSRSANSTTVTAASGGPDRAPLTTSDFQSDTYFGTVSGSAADLRLTSRCTTTTAIETAARITTTLAVRSKRAVTEASDGTQVSLSSRR